MLINPVQVIFSDEDVLVDHLNLVLNLEHCHLVLANHLLEFKELSLVLRIHSQFFAGLLIQYSYSGGVFKRHVVDFLEDFLHDFIDLVDEDVLGCSSPHLEQSTIDFIRGQSFDVVFGLRILLELVLDLILFKIHDMNGNLLFVLLFMLFGLFFPILFVRASNSKQLLDH